ncbi:uncharacterized protein BP01DRAFT_358468 [Aspergillus saccharolyticus JOP 1030-1]|uniref:Uncharacterized protein n=1 Tax=Aspergillus saccharolyticus JOP 1030-1 TaxID=1450539 RepID=A0A318ZAJ4_9EURO|nr:hypothetical protein BP01DRAFT_358468 [Aspergillus saccharolyticus JOP 1030-1]PYH43477.1 hypothetical protein BP01DRAFT_358468 [Aspergillus saccharolyticus JOP 1030-1]
MGKEDGEEDRRRLSSILTERPRESAWRPLSYLYCCLFLPSQCCLLLVTSLGRMKRSRLSDKRILVKGWKQSW